jgi:hypothetical protein
MVHLPYMSRESHPAARQGFPVASSRPYLNAFKSIVGTVRSHLNAFKWSLGRALWCSIPKSFTRAGFLEQMEGAMSSA